MARFDRLIEHIYFTSAEQLPVCHFDVNEEASRGEAYRKKKIWFRLQLTSSCRLRGKQDLRGRRVLSEREIGCSAVLYSLVAELREEDAKDYKNYMRISPELFQEMLERVGRSLEKGDTFMRKALRPVHIGIC